MAALKPIKLAVIAFIVMMMAGTTARSDFGQTAQYLLLWVVSNDYVDSGMRFDAAADCYAKAQNIGFEMSEVKMSAPQFICMPLAQDYPLSIITKQSNNGRFPF